MQDLQGLLKLLIHSPVEFVLVISIDDLIKSKKSLGRYRDMVTVMELETIRKEQES